MPIKPNDGGIGLKPIVGSGSPVAPTLADLTLSTALTNGVSVSGSILGATAGSTIVITLTGLTVNSAARTYTFDGTATAGSTGTPIETLAGATNSPHSSPPITVVSNFLIASQQNHIPNSEGAIANKSYLFQKTEVLPKSLTEVRLRFPAIFLSPGSTGPASAISNDYPLSQSWVSIGGVIQQTKFSGSASRTISVADGVAVGWVDSDPFDITAFGYNSGINNGNTPEGVTMIAMGQIDFGVTGQSIAYTSGLGSIGGGKSQTFDPAATTINYTGAGITTTGTAPTTVAGGTGYSPFFVCKFLETDVQTIVVRGNSQSQNENSWIQLFATTLNWPILNLAVAVSKINGGSTDSRIAALFGLGNHGVQQWGRNEFPGDTVAQLDALVAQDAARMKAAGVTLIGASETPPYTSSTDSWATNANQTYQTAAGSGPGGLDEQYNAGLTAITGIDVALTRSSQRDPTDPRKWLTNGSAFYPTSDGKHATLALETLLAAETKPLFATNAQILKAVAEGLTLTAEQTRLQGDKDAAQTATNSANSAGANTTRLQARINAIVVQTLTTFTDPMGSGYAANTDLVAGGAGWTAGPGYTTGDLQYLGNSNGTKIVTTVSHSVLAPQQGNTFQLWAQWTNRSASGATGKECVLYVDESNWIGVIQYGSTALTRTVVGIMLAGALTSVPFTNGVNSASGQVYRLDIVTNGSGGWKVQLKQSATILAPVTVGTDDITAAITGGLSAARQSAFGGRTGALNPAISTWTSGNLV